MQTEQDRNTRLRRLPQVQRLLEAPEAAGLMAQHGAAALTQTLREVLAALRATLDESAAVPQAPALLAQAAARLAERARPTLRRVVNATGIVLHTNLGRAPMAAAAAAAAAAIAGGYSTLEFDPVTGSRGPRGPGVEALLRELTGAEAALAVNNGAAAILLALSGLAAGGEVVVSRGELVEIGGGFRIPDIIRQGGATLVEVGSTNRTVLADYRAAITPATRALLKVHQSNFRLVGFTAEAPVAALAGLARQHGLTLVADLGSGLLARPRGAARLTEPTVAEALRDGADLVTFSGDKLLGGPQAGLLAGRAELVASVRRHPLLRALRLDKMTLAALEATLRLHRDRPAEIPVLRMLAQDAATLQARAAALLGAIGGPATIEETEGFAGGGALPEERIASRAVRLHSAAAGIPAAELARRLRLHDPAVVGRLADGALLLDMLAVTDAEIAPVAAALRDAGWPARAGAD